MARSCRIFWTREAPGLSRPRNPVPSADSGLVPFRPVIKSCRPACGTLMVLMAANTCPRAEQGGEEWFFVVVQTRVPTMWHNQSYA